MKGKALVVTAGAMLLLSAASAQASILLSDNFEYASQAAFTAAWPVEGTATAVWNTEQASSPTHSVKALTTATRSSHNFGESGVPTDAAPILFRIRYYDSAGTASAYRQYAEIIDSTGVGNLQIIALGLNNNLVSNKYMARIVGIDGGSGVSAFFKLDGAGSPNRSTGWHTLQALIKDNSIDFSVDGVLSKTVTYASTVVDRSYERVRLGSNLSSTQVAYFDDAYVEVTPEPATLAILALGGLAAIRRKRA